MRSSLQISESLQNILSVLPAGIELVAVSKFQPVESIDAAYQAGQRMFGESRVQELLEKIPCLPSDIQWHFIGHLQTNKVKSIIGKTSLIESVDSERLLSLIDGESRKREVSTRVLMQVHVAREETKFGFSPEELMEFFECGKHESLTHTEICGLMAMATNTDDLNTVRNDFAKVAGIFREVLQKYGDNLKNFRILSMGMSGDWPIAVEEGSNLIRVGSAIFGSR